jgi:hypothetical protein
LGVQIEIFAVLEFTAHHLTATTIFSMGSIHTKRKNETGKLKKNCKDFLKGDTAASFFGE